MTKSSRPSDTVQIRFGITWKVKVDNDIDRLHVDTTGKEIQGDQMTRRAVAEFVKDAVAVGMLHLGVDVVTRITQFGDFLRQQLDAVHRVAEDDGLINLKLGEERVETMDLLAFLDVGVKLRDTTQGEFVHEIDTVGVGDELLAKPSNGHGERCRKETNLVILIAHSNDLFEDGLEFRRK